MDLNRLRDLSLKFARAVQVGATQLAQMGDGNGNLTTDETYMYWARILNAPASDASTDPRAYTVVRVRCTRLQPFDKMYVRVATNPYDGVLEVVDVDHFTGAEFFKSLPGGLSGIYSPPHWWTHRLGSQGGTDVLWLDPRQVVLAQVRPVDPPSMSVVVEPYHYIYGSTGKYLAQTTLDLTSYRPSGTQQQLAIICLDPSTNSLTVVQGVAEDIGGVFPAPPPTGGFDGADIAAVTVTPPLQRLAAVRLYGGQTTVDWADILAALHEWGGSEVSSGQLRISSLDPTWGYLAAKLLIGRGLAVATDESQSMTVSGIPDGWASDTAPASPSALDDEFNDSSIDGKWTEYDPLTALVLSEAGTTLSLTVSDAVAWSGLTQTLPAGDFTTVVKVTIPSVTLTVDDQQVNIGLAVLEDPGDPDAAFMVAGYQQVRISGTTRYQVRGLNYPSGDTGGTQLGAALTTAYIRLRRTGTTYSLDVSADAAHWTVIDVSDYVDFTPAALGLLVYNTSGASRVFTADWFRYRDTDDGIDGLVYGQGAIGGATDFLDLTDTPASYTGAGGKVVSVKGDASGLEFTTAGAGDMTKAVYDPDDNGTVSSADDADTVDGQHAAAFAAAGHSHAVDDLSDVTLTDVANGEVLVKDTSAWINQTLAEAGIAAAGHNHDANYADIAHTHDLDDLTDVTITDLADGEVLVSSTGVFINRTLTEAGIAAAGHDHDAAYAGIAHSHAVDDLSDVTITDIANGEVLVKDTSAWINRTLAEAGIAASSHTHESMPGLCGGRLTLTSGTPVTTSDVTGAATLYFTPFWHTWASLYTGGAWTLFEVPELSLSLSGFTANKPFDIFVYPDGSTPTLDAVEWTNTTTRATALVRQNGTSVLTGSTDRLYIGTILITGTAGQCEDSLVKRYVWNNYNRLWRRMFVVDTTNHSYNSATWRQWNATGSNKVEFVLGLLEEPVMAIVESSARAASAGQIARVGFAFDATNTANQAVDNQNTNITQCSAMGLRYPSTVGYHYIAATQSGGASGSVYNAMSLQAMLRM